jgi:hypothetical protein
MGRPPKYPGPSVRDRDIWYGDYSESAGHYCHANVPGNNHGDPGAIAPSRLFALGTPAIDPPEDDDMALSLEDKAFIEKNNQKYANAVNNFVRQSLGNLGRALLAADAASDKAQADRILAELDAETAKLSALIIADAAEEDDTP